ncbi:DUF7402 domain-containing protein [Actinocrispum wychmicini]|uniref:DUF7402 domain-containing protein n=1 Tax=Actinocrispum wychmicini TaxID=1213861 RepID=A0A4R2JBX2_9PSEU|nr:hypothetical protein [Actinocrispum wychmicini]TCO55897.1 hypothetical protein EV192_107320 [Actinocrispum wychmicini]
MYRRRRKITLPRWSSLAAISVFTAALSIAAATQAPAQGPRIAAASVTANFAGDDGVGHPEVFGSGINVPALTDPDKIETLHQTGTRFIRGDVYLGHILPTTTIADYLAAMPAGTGVADSNTWDWSNYGWIDQHHDRGTKTILILSYSVDWLGSTPGGGAIDYSPPNGADGFRVYRDVISKIFKRFRDKIDLIEVWNEPDGGFLGSPSLITASDKLNAYKDIYASAAAGIRDVETAQPNGKRIPIGGPAMSGPDPVQHDPDNSEVDWAKGLLTDSRTAANVDFLSYHTYDRGSTAGEAVQTWRKAAVDAGRATDFPVYVTEWNYDPRYVPLIPMNGNDPNTISYAAARLTAFLKQHANGTNFFADNDELVVPPFFGVHGNGMLPPKARTYRLMSVDLGLGAGDNTLRPVSFPSSISDAGAATTANGDRVAWVVNNTADAQDVDLNLNGLGGATTTTATIFEASPNQTQVRPKASVPLTVSGGSATVRFAAPAHSVVGVRLASYPIADSENLAPGATVTPSSVSAAVPQLNGARVVDGIVGVHETGEWASNQELTPNIRLDWTTPQAVGRVALYDRANPTDRILAGRLEFSDGTTVQVPELPNDGTGKVVSFPVRDVTWMRFVVTDGAGLNVGLSELQVFAGGNVARDGTVTTSSQANLDVNGQLKATDGITTAAGEWVSTETNPWIRISWVNSQVLDRIVLSDRPGPVNANSGTLTFSDGTSVPVTGIPANGAPKVVSFPARPVTWVKFQVTGGSGTGVGLAELRALTTGNVASSAVVTATSTAPEAPTLTPAAATDGVINQWDAGEWASNGEPNPRIRLTWATAQNLRRVVLYDRDNPIDFTTGGTLTFSDGSSVPVSGMDNSGVGKMVTFAPRSVTWVEFQVTGTASSWRLGLSEIEAYVG